MHIPSKRRLVYYFLFSLSFLAFSCFLFSLFFLPNESLEKPNVHYSKNTKKLKSENFPISKKFAYVFYATDPEYACYACVNADRLITDLSISPEIDIIILFTNWHAKNTLDSCAPRRVHLKEVPQAPKGLTDNEYYAQCYVRFEAFRLIDYDRIIILDADGLILRNLDHLFTVDLQGRQVGACLTYYMSRNWLSSVLIVAEPSPILHGKFAKFLDKKNLDNVSSYANGSRYDMDVLNYIFEAGEKATILPMEYLALDSALYYDTKLNKERFRKAFYVHFTMRKPLIYVETQRLRNMSAEAEYVMRIFWNIFQKRCSNLKENVRVALEKFDEMAKEDEELFIGTLV